MLQDKLAVARWERQLRLADRVMQVMKDRGVTPNIAVKPKLALPILEQASLETDDYLQDLWANLLASAMDKNSNKKVRSAFIDIIQQLEPIDVKIVEYLYSQFRIKRIKKMSQVSVNHWKDHSQVSDIPIHKRDLVNALGLDEETYHTAVDNLIRVRLADFFVDDDEEA